MVSLWSRYGQEQNEFELSHQMSYHDGTHGGKNMFRSSELKRKMVHIGNGIWIIVLAFIPRWLSILAVIVALMAVLSMNPRVWNGAFEAMAREIDRRVGFLVGPLIYVITVLVLVVTFDLRVAGAAFAMMAFGDGFAGLIGTFKGKHSLWNGKSIEGTGAFLLFGFILSSISVLIIDVFNPEPQPLFFAKWLEITVPPSLLMFIIGMGVVTVIAAFLELLGGTKIDDNILVPFSVAFLLTVLW